MRKWELARRLWIRSIRHSCRMCPYIGDPAGLLYTRLTKDFVHLRAFREEICPDSVLAAAIRL